MRIEMNDANVRRLIAAARAKRPMETAFPELASDDATLTPYDLRVLISAALEAGVERGLGLRNRIEGGVGQ